MHGEMLIDGHFIGGPCDQSVGKAVIRSPYDGKIVGTAAEGTSAELKVAIESAASAFTKWKKAPVSQRQELLFRIAATVRERRNELADLLVGEIGKPITAAEGEVERLAITFELAAKSLDRWGPESVSLAEDRRGGDFWVASYRVPIGVIFCIVPYNWPYNLTAHKVAPALAAGNTVVIKPSPQALLSTYALARLIHECGCPPGAVNVVDAPVAAVQSALQNPKIAMVSFTGSDKVGWPLKASLPPMTRSALELGGDASVVIFEDADLDMAVARTVSGGFAYTGQICISVQHAWVQAKIYEEVRARLIKAVQDCPFGDPTQRTTVVGPVISVAAAERIEGVINDAVGRGSTVLVGGHRHGTMVEPTLVEKPAEGSALANQEIFGPVLTLRPFTSEQEVIERLNRSEYGLQAGIFTRSPSRIQACFDGLEVGGLVVNDAPTIRFDAAPYGGVKRSGFGREGVGAAMLEMTEQKTRIERLT